MSDRRAPLPRNYYAETPGEIERLMQRAAESSSGLDGQLRDIVAILDRAIERGALELFSDLELARRRLADTRASINNQDDVLHAMRRTMSHQLERGALPPRSNGPHAPPRRGGYFQRSSVSMHMKRGSESVPDAKRVASSSVRRDLDKPAEDASCDIKPIKYTGSSDDDAGGAN